MAVTGIVCFTLLLIIEHRLFEGVAYHIRSLFKRKLPTIAVEGEIDIDVDNEKRKVKNMSVADLQARNLVLKSLSKFYGQFLAVNQISIAIHG